MGSSDTSLPMCHILQEVVERFGQEQPLTAGNANTADIAGLVKLDPQQVLPFDMSMTRSSERHRILAKVSGPLKLIILHTQVLQTAIECCTKLDWATLACFAQASSSFDTAAHSAAVLDGQTPVHQYTSTSEAAEAGHKSTVAAIYQAVCASVQDHAAAAAPAAVREEGGGEPVSL